MSEPEDQETPGSIPNPTYTGPASPGLAGLPSSDATGPASGPEGREVGNPPMTDASPTPGAWGVPPPEGRWFDGYSVGLDPPVDGDGPMHLENLATPLYAPGATMAGGGHFRVDLEHAPQAIADLKHAAELLRQEVQNARDLANYASPGLDAVSTEAVRTISDAAVAGSNSLRSALELAAEEFDRHAGNLQEDLIAYLQVDSVNIPSARGL